MTYRPKSEDGFTYDYVEHTKGDHNSPASVKAITKKKKHKVSIGSVFDGTKQRSFSLEASVSHVEMQSTSPTGLDSDPWAFAQLSADWVKVSEDPSIPGSPFTSMTPYCLNSGAGHTCSHEGDDENNNDDGNNNYVPPSSPATPTPTDGTPNCPDCTSHCLSPCLCTNSGTCNGTVSYHPCGEHLTSVSGDHSWGTYTCGNATHVGYRCQESSDHKTYISSCTSTDANGQTCTNSSGHYECQPHSHTYPPTLVACGGASYTGCSGASSRTEHHVPSCSNCGAGYWTCSEYAYRHTDSKTCKRSGCGATLTPCQNGPNACVRPGKPSNWHWL